MGPTAVGKTDLACSLVDKFPLEIVSVDSAMIYREMNIGSAKPDTDTLAKYPHHFVDIINPIDSYSAGDFCKDVTTICTQIFQRGNFPLLTGGTMMYFNALQKGLAPLPKSNEKIRIELITKVHQHGLLSLYRELTAVDPETAARLHPNDTQRILRALEVFYISGKPLSAIISSQTTSNDFIFINLVLLPQNRAWLHERIASRFHQMLAEGFIDEVKAILDKWQLDDNHPSMRAVGYRQAFAYLNGEYDVADFTDKGIIATRQLAKRQLTWLRSWPDKNVFYAEDTAVVGKVIAKITPLLDNP